MPSLKINTIIADGTLALNGTFGFNPSPTYTGIIPTEKSNNTKGSSTAYSDRAITSLLANAHNTVGDIWTLSQTFSNNLSLNGLTITGANNITCGTSGTTTANNQVGNYVPTPTQTGATTILTTTTPLRGLPNSGASATSYTVVGTIPAGSYIIKFQQGFNPTSGVNTVLTFNIGTTAGGSQVYKEIRPQPLTGVYPSFTINATAIWYSATAFNLYASAIMSGPASGMKAQIGGVQFTYMRIA